MNLKCEKCGGSMQEGFPVDASRHNARVGHWAEGAPSFWLLDILRMKGRRTLPIRSFRCSRCGYLEAYAKEAQRA
ncbi:MAG: hypothetical protein R2862_11735 [Thermoanaerobaculia bacterium]